MAIGAVEGAVVARTGGIREMCRPSLMKDDKFTGQAARIRGRSSAGYGRDMSGAGRGAPENSIPERSRRAGTYKQPEKYGVEHLVYVKRRHGSKLKAAVGREVPDIGFPELDEAVRHVAATGIPPGYSYHPAPPGEIRKNCPPSKLAAGLSRAGAVDRHADKLPDAESAKRLRAGFAGRYGELRSGGLDGGDPFAALRRFASRQKADPGMRTGGQMLPAYLLEKCGVLER